MRIESGATRTGVNATDAIGAYVVGAVDGEEMIKLGVAALEDADLN